MLLLGSGALAWAELVPVGSEFQVNSHTVGRQKEPAMASDASGNFAVVWSSLDQDGDGSGVFGQLFLSTGTPLGPEFQVNTYTLGSQANPAVAMNAQGEFVVVWESLYQDGSGAGLFGQRFDSSGYPLGTEFLVNPSTVGWQSQPMVVMDINGAFIVAWSTPDSSSTGIVLQRFDSVGTWVGFEFQVNTYEYGYQDYPAIAQSGALDFVVVWESLYQDGAGAGVFGQRFSSAGLPLGAEFRVNTYTQSGQFSPSVGMDDDGNFAVVWTSPGQNGNGPGIFGQRFDSSGAPAGSEFQANSYVTGGSYGARVAMNAAGEFLVVWDNILQDGDSFGVFAQQFDSLGFPSGSEFQVNAYTFYEQNQPVATGDPNGNWVVAWQSDNQDGNLEGVFARRFSGPGAGLEADLSVTQIESADPVVYDDTVTYLLTVQNSGPDAADVELTNPVPAGASFVLASPTQGFCSEIAGTVRCVLGSMGSGASANVTLVLAPQASGIQLVNVATASSPAYDPTPSDASSTETTTIVGPYIGDRVWEDRDGDGVQDAGEPGVVSALVYLYSGGGTLLDVTFTDSSGQYRFDVPTGSYFLRFIPPSGHVFSPINQGGDDLLDNDADPVTGTTPVFSPLGQLDAARWDAGVVPTLPCVPPDEPIYVYDTTLTTDGNSYPILHFMDANRLEQITGYNVYRSSDPAPPPASWPLVASDVIDMDEATPNKQWVDTSGDVSPSGLWYYHVNAYNNRCPAEGPF